MADEDERASLFYRLEQEGFVDVSKAFDQLDEGGERAVKRGRELAEAYKSAGFHGEKLATVPQVLDQINEGIEGSVERLESLTDRWGEVREAEYAAADAAEKVSGSYDKAYKSAVSLSRATMGLRTISRIAGVPEVGMTVGAAAELSELANQLPRLKEGISGLPDAFTALISSMGVGGILVTGGLVAVAIGFGKLIEAFNATKAAVAKRIEDEAAIAALTATTTKTRLEELIDEATLDKRIADIRVGIAQENLDRINKEKAANADLIRAVQLLGEAAGARETLEKELDTAVKTGAYLLALIGLREDENVAINTAIQDFIIHEQKVQDLVRMYNEIDISAQVFALTASSEAIEANVAAMKVERDARQKAIDQQVVSGDAMLEYRKRIVELNATITAQAALLPDIIIKELAEGVTKHTIELQKIGADAAAKTAEAVIAQADAIAEAERAAFESRSEAQRDAALEQEKEQKRHEDAIAKILRDYNTVRSKLLQDRDVVGLQQAKIARKEALLEENKGNEDRKKAIDDALKEQNRLIDIRLAEQNRQIQRNYDKAAKNAQDASDKALAIENKRYADEVAAAEAGAAAILGVIDQFWKDALAKANGALAGSSAALPSGSVPIPAPTPSPGNLGGMVLTANQPRGGFAATSAAETGRNAPAGFTVNLNVNGATRRSVEATSKEQARRIFDDILKELGV